MDMIEYMGASIEVYQLNNSIKFLRNLKGTANRNHLRGALQGINLSLDDAQLQILLYHT